MTAMDDPPHQSLMELDAVIFDMDGVVTDTAKVHAAAWKQLFDEFLRDRADKSGEPFVAFDERADYESYVDGKNRYDGVRSFLQSRGISLPEGDDGDPGDPDQPTVRGLGNQKDQYFLARVRADGVHVYESTVTLIRALKARGIRTGLVTASRNADEVLSAGGVQDLWDTKVDGVVAAELGLAGKPDPATYNEAAARLGVDRARAAVVEDAVSGVEAGHRGGFGVVVGVARGGQASALRAAGATVVVEDLGELDRG
jgi:beta-phosphoglucomutase family hydrolase